MDKLQAITAYFCNYYPHPQELSKTRLTKMVYLADWRAAITEQRRLTNITWRYDHFGPYVPDIYAIAAKHPYFKVEKQRSWSGNSKEVISYIGKDDPATELSIADKRVLDHVIRNTEDLNWSDFINVVYSTYPIISQEKYSTLDLLALAREYKEAKELILA